MFTPLPNNNTKKFNQKGGEKDGSYGCLLPDLYLPALFLKDFLNNPSIFCFLCSCSENLKIVKVCLVYAFTFKIFENLQGVEKDVYVAFKNHFFIFSSLYHLRAPTCNRWSLCQGKFWPSSPMISPASTRSNNLSSVSHHLRLLPQNNFLNKCLPNIVLVFELQNKVKTCVEKAENGNQWQCYQTDICILI